MQCAINEYSMKSFVGCRLNCGRCHRCNEHSGEMAARQRGLLPQLAQHYARARRGRRLLDAPGKPF